MAELRSDVRAGGRSDRRAEGNSTETQLYKTSGKAKRGTRGAPNFRDKCVRQTMAIRIKARELVESW